jgi:hypothetical protein
VVAECLIGAHALEQADRLGCQRDRVVAGRQVD